MTAPGGPSTYDVVNRQVLEALGPDGILINAGRGSVVESGTQVIDLVLQNLQAYFSGKPLITPLATPAHEASVA